MNILDNYPVFENNQVLTSDQLNNLVKYLDQQNRLTRAQLIGIGNVCGFNIKYDTTENALTITKGVGITSDGFLLEQGDCTTRWYKKYDYTKLNITYPPFEDITDKNHTLDVELFELLSKTTDPANEFKLSEKFLSDKVVLLFLEIFDQDLKTCLAKSCDEIGQTKIFTIRMLLISTKHMDKVLQKLNIYSYDPTFPNKFELPVITIPRVNIKPEEEAAKDKMLLLNKYKDSVETIKNVLFDAIKLTYKTYNPILKDLYEKDYFGAGKIIDEKALKWETYLDNDSYGAQYFYDFIKDLTLAYNEFKNTAFELCNECLVDMERFPLHLMLGLAIPDKDYNIDSTHYRNRFIHSPAYSIQKYLTQKTRSLHQRMVSMIISFDLEYISKTDTKIKDLYIIPSHEKLSSLSDRAIPFYYYPDNKDIPLIDHWNFDIEKRELSDYILSYHHLKNPYPLEVRNALKYNIDKYSFLRTEGLLGKEVEFVKNTLEKQKKDYNLSFKIVTLQLNPSANELVLDPSLWCDLDLLYFNARLAYLDVFQKLSYDIKIIKSYSLPLKFTSIDVDATQRFIDDAIKNLPERINDFIFQDFFKSYCLLLELLQEYKVSILHYQGRLIHELINVISKDDFQKGIIQINSSLSFIQKILDFGVYKELYLLFYRLETRKQYLKENHPSIFANFLMTNPGLNHEGGTKDDGTIILVSELDETDKKFKVFADFTLPYLCCCDCNDIPCTDDEIEYSQLPHMALPDGILCEINLPVEIEVLNNDYILSGSDLVLSSKSPLVKCDQQSKIITYLRKDDFTGLDTFAYTLDRKIVKKVEIEQPKIAKKRKVYFDAADFQVENLSSANVKVLLHNKYELHIQANEDFEITSQHDELIIDVLSNDTSYNTTEIKLPEQILPLGGTVEVVNISGKKFGIKYIPKRAGKDSFKYQLIDKKRDEESEATVNVFVVKSELTLTDIVYQVKSIENNDIYIDMPDGWKIYKVPSLPKGMGSLSYDSAKPIINFVPGELFANSNSLSFSYLLLNLNDEPVKGIVHLLNSIERDKPYIDFFNNVMAGSIMSFGFDPALNDSNDIMLVSANKNEPRVVKTMVSILNLSEEDAKAFVNTAPVIIKKGLSTKDAKSISNSLIEAGAIVEIQDWFIQNGWLICDGSTYDRKRYERLFKRINTIYGEGNGQETFNVPDLRSQFIRGWEPGRRLGIKTKQDDQFQRHKHYDPSHTHNDMGHNHTDAGHYHYSFHLNSSRYAVTNGAELTSSSAWGFRNSNERGVAAIQPSSANILASYSNLGDPVDSGAGSPRYGTETRPKNMAVLFCIKY